MNVTTTSFSPTQMILAWTLLIVLLSWFILFTALALREFVMKKVEWEDISTPSRPVPINAVQPKEEHRQIVGTARGATHNERTNTEESSDSGTTLIR
jgi:hypothetical protein